MSKKIVKISPEKKRCPRCKEEKSVTDFYRNIAQKCGLTGWCKKCHLGWFKGYYQKHKERSREYDLEVGERGRNIIAQVKELGCGCCPEVDERTLVFHHVDSGDKKFCVGGGRRSVVTLVKELEKCELICANCHAKRR